MPDIRVWYTRLDVDPSVVHALAASLSEDERNRAARFYFDRDRRRFLVARGVLRSILGSVLGVEPGEVRFRYGDRGKPFLAQEFTRDLSFNVAHSEDHAMFVVSDGSEVGVDIETIRPMADVLALADGFFSPAERTALHTLLPSVRLTGFFECWTRKEAFVKALGEGLAHPLDSFDVPITGARLDGPRMFADTPAAGWSVHDISELPLYAAAVVTRGGPARVQVQGWMTESSRNLSNGSKSRSR